jgi:hypothetical protein
MESPEAREQAVYGMVKHVLQNQITTHDVSLGIALTGCAMMLTSACLALYDTADDIETHMPFTIRQLKEHLPGKTHRRSALLLCPPRTRRSLTLT